jgi:single-stranded-DNA-specific exonuclease
MKIKLGELGISSLEMKKAITRIEIAIKNKEKIIVYGDYDADGITASAIIWEALFSKKADVMPYIPDRFEEGYGINTKSLTRLKEQNQNLKLIITVDNGIVAHDAVDTANKLGIDVIVTDHHEPAKTKPNAFAIIHTKKIAGSGVSFILSRELTKTDNGLELAAIGTIADQLPLTHANRSFAKYGIEKLRKTKRFGLIALLKQASVKIEEIGTYEINYIIAPRINSMGRLKHGIESLRLLCTKDKKRAEELSKLISKTNLERQEIVEKTVLKATNEAKNLTDALIFISDKSYHEGIIGLAAGKIVEEFYRPAIVISIGEKFSKGSARSISGFNIVEIIREHSEILVAHGGHTMAAGFTIETSKLEDFRDRINETAKKLLTDEILTRKLKIDSLLDFKRINWELINKLKNFEPSGMGNPTPLFATFNVEVLEVRFLSDGKHVKLKVKKDNKYFDAIGFGMGEMAKEIKKNMKINISYNLEENVWRDTKSLQLRLKDLQYTYAEEVGPDFNKGNSRKNGRRS